jgi:hypothetical protein
MDYDYWLKARLLGKFLYINEIWATYRIHPTSKSSLQQAIRWADAARILEAFFHREDIPKYWRKFYPDCQGKAHWKAAVEYFKLNERVKAQSQLDRGAALAPKFIQSNELAALLVGNLARNVNVGHFEFINTFFNLVPVNTPGKEAGYQKCLSRASALLAINPDTPSSKARHFAREAIKKNPKWLFHSEMSKTALFGHKKPSR